MYVRKSKKGSARGRIVGVVSVFLLSGAAQAQEPTPKENRSEPASASLILSSGKATLDNARFPYRGRLFVSAASSYSTQFPKRSSSPLVPDTARGQAPLGRIIGSLLGVGGYFLTSSSGQAALGDVKFAQDAMFFGRPAHFGPITLAGGVEYFSAGDHFFPFTNGNVLSLFGPAVKVSTPYLPRRVRPFVTAGLFAGRVRSERLGFDRTDFTPSLTFGADWHFVRYVSVSGAYRVSERVAGVDINGFYLSAQATF